MQCACAILSICGLPRSTVFFHIISQTARSSKKTSYRKQKCVLISLHLLSETFLNQEEMNEIWLKNVYWFPCKVKVKVKPAKTGHGPHSSSFLCCSMYCLFCDVLCIVCVYMCTVLLSPGGYPIAVKYIISYHIISSHLKDISDAELRTLYWVRVQIASVAALLRQSLGRFICYSTSVYHSFISYRCDAGAELF